MGLGAELRTILKSLRGPRERLEPPIVLAQAVASVVGESSIEKSAVSKINARDEGGQPSTQWRYVALLDDGLVVAEASNTVADWENGTRDTDPEPQIDVCFVPIRELTFCRVDGVVGYYGDPTEWSARWSVGVRTGPPVKLPAMPGSESEQAASELGAAIVTRLRTETRT